jgi:ElaB/YqjD/DUF883 family membrane-anchored ribosome-binding protein
MTTTKPQASGTESPSDDARALLDAASKSTSESVTDAAERLSQAIDGGKRMYGRVREQVVDSAKAADGAIHAHPYIAVAIGVGAGALIGYLLGRRGSQGCK